MPSLPGLSPRGPELADVAAVEGMERRILGAALVCFGRFGVSKTTLDDVAREAGCSRATLYRYFPGKRALVQSVVDAEGVRIAAEVELAGASADTLEDAVVGMMLTAASELVHHEALQFALQHEPELVLPFISFDGADEFLAGASIAFAPVLVRHLPADRAPRAAEFCTRVLLALLCSEDGTRISMTDEESVRSLVRQFVLPGLQSGSNRTTHGG
jgi:AcrR family transcriptional regulator